MRAVALWTALVLVLAAPLVVPAFLTHQLADRVVEMAAGVAIVAVAFAVAIVLTDCEHWPPTDDNGWLA